MILEQKRKKPKRRTRALPSRNKESYGSRNFPKGRILRVSSAVFALLLVKKQRKESWDQLLRRLLNVPQRDGRQEKLYECWVLRSTGETARTKALARGKAVKNGILKGTEKIEEPIRVRETI